MTRKKSNVKALALAVTCAILAGGYSGLNPVYAGNDISKDTASGTITISGSEIAGALENIDIGSALVGSSTLSGSISSLSTQITNAKTDFSQEIAKVNQSIETESGKIMQNVSKNQADINALQTTVGNNNSGLIKDVADLKTTVGDSQDGLVKDVNTVKDRTTNISYNASSRITTIDGVTIKDGVLTAKEKLTLSHANDDGSTTYGSLDYNEMGQLSQLLTYTTGDKTVITAGDGSKVGDVEFKAGAVTGVKSINSSDTGSNFRVTEDNDKYTFKAGNFQVETGKENGTLNGDVTLSDTNRSDQHVTIAELVETRDKTKGITRESNGQYTDIEGKLKVYNDGKVIINEGDAQQVTIDGKGIKVGQNSSRMNDITGFATSKNLYVGADDADNPTKDTSRFYVDGSDGSVKAADGKFTVDKDGNVFAAGNVTANQAGFNNLAVTNGLTVGSASATGNYVNMLDGNITATGKAKSKTLAAGTNGDEFTVDADGALSAANNKFSVDKDGNTTVGGTLNVTGDTTLGGNLGVTGNATVGGTLNVTGDTTLGGNLGVTGNVTVGGTLNSKGNFSVGDNDEFTVDATNGNVVSKGKITAESGKIGAVEITNDGTINGVKSITTDTLTVINGFITNGNIESKGLKVNGNGEVTGSLSVTGAVTGASFNGATITSTKFNGAEIDATGNIAAGTYNGASITSTKFNGAEIDATGNITAGTYNGNTITADKKFNDVKLDSGNVEATKVTAGTITDGNGFTATNGNVSAKDITADNISATTGTIAGVNFATGGNVTGVNNLTATGTVQAATLKVNDNNVLDSNGLKAEKAVIDNITIDGASITSSNADGSVGIAGITADKTGALTRVTSIDGVAVAGSTASGLTVGSGATAVTIGGNSMALSSTNFGVDNDGDVTGQSFTAGNSYLKDGELKLNDANIWTTAEGIKAEKATIGANTLDSTGFSTTGSLGVAGKATFGSNAGDSTTIEQGAVSVTQNGKTTTIKGGEIETDKLTVNDIVLKNSMQDGAGNTITISGSDGSMSVASGAFAVDKEGQLKNKVSGTEGGYTYETNLETSKTGINANYTNGVNGNNNLLSINKDGVALGVTDSTNQKLGGFAANEDNASLSYGDDNSIVVDETTITSALGSDVSTTLTNNGADQSIISKVTDNTTSTIKADGIEDKVGTAKRSLTEAEIVDDVAGMTVKTNADGTLFTNGTNSTLINGSKLTSTNGAASGVLDGSNLTLTNGNNKTELTAGGASFTGAAGEKGGTTTTIDGGTITTDTLNVERINLGGEVIDKGAAGVEDNSKLYMDAKGNFRAASGNFKVAGADGAMTNTVGNTTLKTDAAGAGMSYAGSVNSNVSVADGKANVSAGVGSIDVTNESITSKVTDNATSTITKDSITDKVGGTTVATKDGSFSVKGNGGNGMNIDTNTGKTTFTGASGTTTIDGSTITTGKLVTDELVITGQGDAAGDGGSIAFGGNGTIKSDIKDGAKNTQFTTDIDGVTTKVTDGTNTTTNEVAAAGNTNTVTNGTATSKNIQTATSIGGVITNGTVKIAQTLDSENGNITNEVTDKDGNSSKLEQNGTGLTYTDSTNADNATRINSSDVSIGSATDDSKRINLSDLGQIDDLDSELSARDEFKNNSTAVGGINAEAAARRADVARLDGRIDDVNNRVDKVGAMAAAIASLKSIGYDPQAPSEFSVGLGQYKGETGVALGFFHYPNKNFMINVSLSTAGGETMGGIGATWRFGHKSPQKLLDEQREAQAKKELAAAEKYKAAAQLAKEAQERAEYAAKLARQAQVSADNAKAAADATQAKHFNK